MNEYIDATVSKRRLCVLVVLWWLSATLFYSLPFHLCHLRSTNIQAPKTVHEQQQPESHSRSSVTQSHDPSRSSLVSALYLTEPGEKSLIVQRRPSRSPSSP